MDFNNLLLSTFFIPSLLTYFLSYYSHENIKKLDLISSSGSGSSTSTSSKFNPVMIWRLVLINSTPIFTVLEGFCSLLLIQAMGQTMSWLTIYKSDSWLIISLIGSGSVITASFYFYIEFMFYHLQLICLVLRCWDQF